MWVSSALRRSVLWVHCSRIKRRRASKLNRTNRCVYITVFRLLFYALQIMTRSGLGHSLRVPYCIETISPWLLSHPRPPRHRRVIFTPGRAVFAPNCFVELALSLRLVPELLTWGGGEPVQTTSGIARNLEMSRAPRRAESTGRLTRRARQATHNARQTIAAWHVIHGTRD